MMNFKWKDAQRFVDKTELKKREELQKYLEDAISHGEDALGYGLWAMGYRIPIYFVSEKEINALGQNLNSHVQNSDQRLQHLYNINELEKGDDPELGIEVVEDSNQNMRVVRSPGPDNVFDPLGLYFHDGPIEQKGPEIFVSYEKINRLYNKNGIRAGARRATSGNRKKDQQKCDHITCYVLAHELGHAIMDAEAGGLYQLNCWVEEPLANLIALEYFDAAGPSYSGRKGLHGIEINGRLEDAKEFTASSPIQYRLGLDMFLARKSGIDFDWRHWRAAKWSMSLKSNVERMNNWKKEVVGTIGNVDVERIVDMFNELTTPPFKKCYEYNSFVGLYANSLIGLPEKAAFIADRFLRRDQYLHCRDGLIVVVANDFATAEAYSELLQGLLPKMKILRSDSLDEIKEKIQWTWDNDGSDYRILVTDQIDERVVWITHVCAVYFDKDPQISSI